MAKHNNTLLLTISSLRCCCLIGAIISSYAASPGSGEPAYGNSNNYHNGFQLHNSMQLNSAANGSLPGASASTPAVQAGAPSNQKPQTCSNGLLTFELSTGFIYKPSTEETLAMMPSTLQLTDCLDFCLHNSSCLAINFEMGLCVLLSSSAKQNPTNLYSSQFPVFTIYAEKKCLLLAASTNGNDPSDLAQSIKVKRRCQRAWTFERVAGYEMKTKARRKLKVASKELCMEACLLERDFECRSANWYRQTGDCSLSDQDRHSVSQSEAGDQRIKSSLNQFYGPSDLTGPTPAPPPQMPPNVWPSAGLYENYYALQDRGNDLSSRGSMKQRQIRQLYGELRRARQQQFAASFRPTASSATGGRSSQPLEWPSQYVDQPAHAAVDYLENNCIYEPNKLCEFRKIQNRVLKTVDSIYQDVASLEECKQKCLNAPYRCYSFDYGDTSDRVCRTSHLDQASLLSVREPYLDVVGAITYELAACYNVSIQCRAKEMVAQVSLSKMFKGKIYAKSRPSSCVNDVKESLQFELVMRYHDEACDVKASSNANHGVFSNDIVIQHHDRIVTTQDVGLSVYCHYDLGNRSITNNVDLAIERIDDPALSANPMESKMQLSGGQAASSSPPAAIADENHHSSLVITSLATTVVRSPNVTMTVTNMNGQPVNSATVGDRLALLFEIKDKSTPFGIFVREIIAMDGKQLMQNQPLNANNSRRGYHYANGNTLPNAGASLDSASQEPISGANSVQFIDSDGCPTDANIMGPLIKMDHDGRRLLAPFDAFKFPGSDMVFFRAVVSSCIAECKPTICPGSPPISLEDVASTIRPPLPSSTGGADLNMIGSSSMPQYFMSSSRNSPLQQRTTNVMHPMDLTTLASSPPTILPGSSLFGQSDSPTNQPDLLQRRTDSTAAPSAPQARSPRPTPAAELLPQHKTTSSGDSLTTVAGFGSTMEDSGGETSPNWILGEPAAGTNTNKQSVSDIGEQYQLINATNNHQQGSRPASRPPVSNEQKFALQSINLNSLSTEQKKQLVRAYEQRLKQQPGSASNNNNNNNGSSPSSISEMADLYTGFLTSIMLNGLGDNASSSASSILDQQTEQSSGATFKRLASGQPVKPDEADGGDLLAQATNDRKADLDGYLSYLINEHQRRSSSEDAGDNQLDDLIQQIVVSNNNGPTDDQSASTSGEGGGHASSQTSSNKHRSQQQADSAAIPTATSTSTTTTSTTTTTTTLAPSTASVSASKAKAVKANPSQQQGRRNVPSQSAPVQGAVQRKRDKVALQQLADSYLGAYQSYGRRRRRRSVDDTLASYSYLELPQSGVLAPSVLKQSNLGEAGEVRFTSAIVEMYHNPIVAPCPSAGVSTQQMGVGVAFNGGRNKRDVGEQSQVAQPSYDMDELIIQSVKIVDRLHFHPDTVNSQSSYQHRPARWPQQARSSSLNRSSLVTSSQHQLKSKGIDHSELEWREEENWRPTIWSGAGAISLVGAGLCFIFIQVFLVLVYLMNWDRRRWLMKRHSSPPAAAFRRPNMGYIRSSPSSVSGATCTSQLDSSTLNTSTSASSLASIYEQPVYGRTLGRQGQKAMYLPDGGLKWSQQTDRWRC